MVWLELLVTMLLIPKSGNLLENEAKQNQA